MEKSWVFHNFPEAPLPPPPRGRGLAAEEETASALLSVSFAFLKKEMKFLLTNEGEALSSSSSAGKNGEAPFFWRSGIALLGSCGVAFVRSLPIIQYFASRRGKSQVAVAAIP